MHVTCMKRCLAYIIKLRKMVSIISMFGVNLFFPPSWTYTRSLSPTASLRILMFGCCFSGVQINSYVNYAQEKLTKFR